MIARTLVLSIATALTAASAFGQTVYKCPQPDGVMKIQQTPCTITGGGEVVTVNMPKSSGEGLRDSERAYLEERNEYWNQRAIEEEDETARVQQQETLKPEREKNPPPNARPPRNAPPPSEEDPAR